MLHIPFGNLTTNCSKVSRRDALTVGATGLFGGLSLPNLLEMQANAASKKSAKAKSCIFIMLEGGKLGDPAEGIARVLGQVALSSDLCTKAT